MLIRLWICLWLLVASFSSLAEVTVITSFPEQFYSQVAKQFKRQQPGVDLHFINKKTPALIAHFMQGRQPEPDLVWVSSSDAMALMQQMGYIQPPITFAWSEFGFFWHNDVLTSHRLPLPVSWQTLISPAFEGQIALTAPSRSGTNHIVIELILQEYGWQKGWALIAQLGGNLATITARSFGVRQGIIKQRFAVAPVVDFFYKNAKHEGEKVGYTALPNAPLVPAQIALNARSHHAPQAQLFIDFLLSESGQRLLSSPPLNRLSLQQALEQREARSGATFDQTLSAERYHLVNRLFDAFVTERLASLQKFWRMWHELDQRALTTEQRHELLDIFRAVTKIPVDESVARDPKLNHELSPINRYSNFYRRLTTQWQEQLNRSLSLAIARIERLSIEVTKESGNEKAP